MLLCSLHLPRSLNVLLAGKHNSDVLLRPVSSLLLRLVSTAILHPATALRSIVHQRDMTCTFFSIPLTNPPPLSPPLSFRQPPGKRGIRGGTRGGGEGDGQGGSEAGGGEVGQHECGRGGMEEVLEVEKER